MKKILKFISGFLICLFSLFLPYRLRILFSEFLGRIINSLYKVYIGIINYIIKEVSK